MGAENSWRSKTEIWNWTFREKRRKTQLEPEEPGRLRTVAYFPLMCSMECDSFTDDVVQFWR